MADVSAGGVKPVQPAKVDFTYAITDLSEVSYIEVGNTIRQFTVQTAAYWAILTNLLAHANTPALLQAGMAAKYKPHVNFYVMSPEYDYRQPAFFLSHPERQKMDVHSSQIQKTIGRIVEEAMELQQLIIRNADLDVAVSEDQASFKGKVAAKLFGIGPSTSVETIELDTGNPAAFIKSLIKLFKLEKSTTVVNKAPYVILKFLPKYMSTIA